MEEKEVREGEENLSGARSHCGKISGAECRGQWGRWFWGRKTGVLSGFQPSLQALFSSKTCFQAFINFLSI